jgi:hypothetical protein
MLAVDRGHEDIVGLLLYTREVDVEAVEKTGCTTLQLAEYHRQNDMVYTHIKLCMLNPASKDYASQSHINAIVMRMHTHCQT